MIFSQRRQKDGHKLRGKDREVIKDGYRSVQRLKEGGKKVGKGR